MIKSTRVPRRGGSGVAFMGVEFKDAIILLASIFIGLFCGSALGMGNTGYVGIPVAGYFANRLYVEWQRKTSPGALRNFLFSKGILGYTPTLRKQETLFVGDSTAINKDSKKWIDEIIEKTKRMD